MKCPHCQVAFNAKDEEKGIGEDATGYWDLLYPKCSACARFVMRLKCWGRENNQWTVPKFEYLVLPKTVSRPMPPTEVPEEYSSGYKEAALVLSDSPKASAALSRRCLQHLLREKVGVKKSDLSKESDEVINSGKLPSYLSAAIDAIRAVGNFAAHPMKSTATGEIIAVEEGEAEWILDVLDSLFDFYFVQPKIIEQRRTLINEKLLSANKPPLKS